MNHSEFVDLHANFIKALENYFHEARKTSRMLEDCTLEPLSFWQRFQLLSQEIVERDAYQIYLEAKGLLHRAALHGFRVRPQGPLPAAMLASLKG